MSVTVYSRNSLIFTQQFLSICNFVYRNTESVVGSLVTREKLLETMKLAGMTVSGAVSEIETEDR